MYHCEAVYVESEGLLMIANHYRWFSFFNRNTSFYRIARFSDFPHFFRWFGGITQLFFTHHLKEV